MKRLVIAFSVSLTILTMPQAVSGEIATVQTRITAVHGPGSAEGMQFGALTLSWEIVQGAKPEVVIARWAKSTKATMPGKTGRTKIGIKDLKPGMTVAVEMSSAQGGLDWMLISIHVFDPTRPLDPLLIKALGLSIAAFNGSVARFGPPAAGRKGDLGQLEVRNGQAVFVFHIDKGTVIVLQTADGQQKPAKIGDLKAGCSVVATYPNPAPLAPPPAPPGPLERPKPSRREAAATQIVIFADAAK